MGEGELATSRRVGRKYKAITVVGDIVVFEVSVQDTITFEVLLDQEAVVASEGVYVDLHRK